MNKKMREIKVRMEEKYTLAKALRETKDDEKALLLLNEYDDLKNQYQLEEKLFEAEKQLVPDVPAPAEKKEEDTVKAFAQAARTGFQKSMNEGTDTDGGYTVPEDIVTRVETLRESGDSLQTLVRVENVTTLSGARTFKKRAQQTGFSKVDEGGEIAAGTTPQFTRLAYSVDKYAGYFPVTNELLSDTDANITGTLIDWIGNESRVTRNKLILDVIKTQTSVALTSLDDLKKTLNVDLLPVFRNTSKIITNQDGLQHFDILKDSDGRYLLQPMVGDPTRRILFGCELVVLGNDTLPSDVSVAKKRGIPLIIGDLNEGVILFNRKSLEIKSSDVAMNAFQSDLTLFRAIEREDVKIRDDKAFINGVLTIPDNAVTGTPTGG